MPRLRTGMDARAHDWGRPMQPHEPEVTPVDKKAKQPKKPKTATAKPKGTSKTT